jgi:heme exporter protein A
MADPTGSPATSRQTGLRLSGQGLAMERGGRPVFSGISLAVGAGEMLLVTGPNGAGKSTLLRILAGLLEPTEGAVGLAPRSEVPIREMVHYLGHLNGLKPSLSVADNLGFWQAIGGAPDRAAGDALEAVGLSAVMDLPAAYLSAGQKRRVAMARLLLNRRPVWLLDEPTAALDRASEARFGEILAGHLRQGGLAVVASHLPLAHPGTHHLELGAA